MTPSLKESERCTYNREIASMTFTISLQPIEGVVPRSNQTDHFHKLLGRELRRTAASIQLRGGAEHSFVISVNYPKLMKKFESPDKLRKAIMRASEGAFVIPRTIEFEVSKPIPFSKRGEGQASVVYDNVRVNMSDDSWPSALVSN